MLMGVSVQTQYRHETLMAWTLPDLLWALARAGVYGQFQVLAIDDAGQFISRCERNAYKWMESHDAKGILTGQVIHIDWYSMKTGTETYKVTRPVRKNADLIRIR